jgi:hypothetical protein
MRPPRLLSPDRYVDTRHLTAARYPVADARKPRAPGITNPPKSSNLAHPTKLTNPVHFETATPQTTSLPKKRTDAGDRRSRGERACVRRGGKRSGKVYSALGGWLVGWEWVGEFGGCGQRSVQCRWDSCVRTRGARVASRGKTTSCKKNVRYLRKKIFQARKGCGFSPHAWFGTLEFLHSCTRRLLAGQEHAGYHEVSIALEWWRCATGAMRRWHLTKPLSSEIE